MTIGLIIKKLNVSTNLQFFTNNSITVMKKWLVSTIQKKSKLCNVSLKHDQLHNTRNFSFSSLSLWLIGNKLIYNSIGTTCVVFIFIPTIIGEFTKDWHY